jgi:hypothetical protein
LTAKTPQAPLAYNLMEFAVALATTEREDDDLWQTLHLVVMVVIPPAASQGSQR